LNNEKEVAGLLLIRRANYPQEGIDVSKVVVDALEPVSLIVELRQSVSRTVNYPEDLRQGDHEVEDLR
jgi:hypothetical protein